MMTAYPAYVKPKLMYAAPVWSLIMKCDIQCLERAQQRFTKRLGNLYDTSYYECPISLNALTLEHERTVSDVSLLQNVCMLKWIII